MVKRFYTYVKRKIHLKPTTISARVRTYAPSRTKRTLMFFWTPSAFLFARARLAFSSPLMQKICARKVYPLWGLREQIP